MKRVKTGIKGFDELVEGGFPEESTILVCGMPGTGKTIFCLEFLYRGASQFGETGLYISLEEISKNLKEQGKQFGWDLEKLERDGKIHFFTIPVDMYDINIVQTIQNVVIRTGAKRMVIDSVSALFMNASSFKMPLALPDNPDFVVVDDGASPSTDHIIRDNETFIYNLIYRISKFGTTTLITGDSPGDGKLTKDGVSEFVCDGVIHIDLKDFGKTVSRLISIKKLRRTNIEPGYNTLKFTKSGLQISPFNY